MSGHAALSAPTVGAALAAAATSHPTGLTAVGPSGVATNTSWAEVHHRACRAAAALRGLGAGPGDVVFVVGSVSSDLVAVIQGCLLAGATLSVLPTPWRVRTAAGYLAQVRAAIHTARPRLLVADEPARRALAGLNHDVRLVDLAELVELPAPGQAPRSLPPRSPHQPVLLQFTSGSTSDPRAVVITEAQLLGHVEAISSAAGFRQGAETFVSWLPLYHDMGLIGFLLLPMLLGFDVVLADPTVFMQDPSTWMRLCAVHRATVTGAPNFAYGRTERALASMDDRLDLSGLRLAFNGGEPIMAETVEGFLGAARRHGFPSAAMYCVYGLAEATLAVSFPPPGEAMQLDVVDRARLQAEQRAVPTATGRRLVRLGRPIPGVALRIVDPDLGKELAERVLGEVQIRGPSVTTGYYGPDDHAAAGLFDSGWLRTGDLGYQAEGELVLCGRHKDLIIVAGRNVFPSDVELAASRVPGVRRGGVVAFEAEPAAVVVVAERRTDEVTPRQIVEAVWNEMAVPVRDVVLVPPGTVPKTTSGKLRRSRCRRLYQERRLLENG